ncbi:MAG TPA: MOSC domain-containing protein [Prolixibacteraceae bacterium]|nr:MOSC domain-containing protein [Prolixibacteraceae bacterium]
MKVISTNTGKARDIEWNGRIVKTGIFKFPAEAPIFLGNEDVENDDVIDRRYHGGVDKACYLYSADHYAYWRNLYPALEMPWGMFGENLTVEGLDEAEVNIGDIFEVGETIVQATQPRQPCFKLGFRFHNNEIVRQFVDSGFAGVYVRVLQKGRVKTGDEFKLIEKKQTISIRRVYELIYTDVFNKRAVEIAINDPFIAQSCRKDLIKRWGQLL